jgi:DNA-directed RNA polymerase sigma subunit (sigma70/sigma32)
VTLRELAEVLGISAERVRQLEGLALDKLRRSEFLEGPKTARPQG